MTSENATKNRGPWTHRFLIGLFSVVLTILAYWLLDFVVDDIGKWPGPSYQELQELRLDQKLVAQSADLDTQINDTQRGMEDVKGRQQLLRDSTNSSQQTMNQLLDIQRLSLEKSVTPLPEEQQALALFLANQTEYQRLNEQAVGLNETLRELERSKREINQTISEQSEPIRKEYEGLYRRHQLKVASVKLAVLVPLLLVAVMLFIRFRGGVYSPLIYAFGIALVLKVGMVMHEYFPTEYFKYVLIVTALVVVLCILAYLLRMIASPNRDWLLKQYREAYELFLCPVCSYPIRRGPLKYAYWTRRSIKKLRVPRDPALGIEHEYTCPMCSTRLFEDCESCHGIRHSLLPTCNKCGNTQTVDGLPTN